jgi:MoaA/NifB/PqqE/SkfB family radical SAM enzyme
MCTLNLKNILKEKLHNAYKKEELKKHYLQYLFLEITKKCNLNCLHCGSDCSKDISSPELTTESWFKIIDYFKSNFSESVVFVITGG